jgi:outer membrane cobalamin receptor
VKPIPSLLLVCSLVLPAFSGAQTPSPYEETVVVTASADKVPLRNVGRSLVVLSRRDIERLPARSVADVLRHVASVEVRARGVRGVQSDFQIRGAGFGQALVLVDGVRLNDAQSGHHNGDIPVPLDDVERIEVLLGPGSSLHGADAFGGVVNVITRTDRPAVTARAGVGSFDTRSAAASASGRAGSVRGVLSFENETSDGFAPDRDYRTTGLRGSAAFGAHTTLTLAHLDRAFGAAGFYGPAPSREWTRQTLATAERRFEALAGWSGSAALSYRTHRDRFVYDGRQPALSDNRHRTHAAGIALRGTRRASEGTRVSVGLDGGGDWIRSSNLGDRSYARASGSVEVQQLVGDHTFVYPGVRVDAYERFGTAVSPALSVATQLRADLKLRAAAGRAFRVPTFTELYYRDPNHQASEALVPESAWSFESGLDWTRAGTRLSATGFMRLDDSLIDWVRETPAVRWRTTNVRDARTRGIELAARRPFGTRSELGVQYAWLDTRAPGLDLLSKYVLDFARHSVALTGTTEAAGVTAGTRLDWKRRADGRSYWLFDARVARAFGPARLYVEGTNLLDADYQEVRGVVMPGRAVFGGVEVRR